MRNKVQFFKTRFLAAAACFMIATTAMAQPTDRVDAKQLWQLIDYVAVDYRGAVADGTIVSTSEYAEMLDFTENAQKQVAQLPAHPARNDVAQAINTLHASVVRKANAKEVARLAHRANTLLIAAYPIPVAPKSIPDLNRGYSLYIAQCATCHGANGAGDGALAASLEPKPIAFTDAERASSRSVMALYQVVSQGVAGTSMPSFASLSEEDRWSLAFYVGTLAHDPAMRKHGEQLWNSKDSSIKDRFPDLSAITTTTEMAAAETLPKDVARDVTAYLRTNPAVIDVGRQSGLMLARLRLQESLAALRAGDKANATRLGLSAYLDGFEPIEPIVGARDKTLLIAIEGAMLHYRSAVAIGTTEQAEQAANNLIVLFARVEALLSDAKADPTTTFVGALTILLREGVEALLIVIGMIAILKKAERKDALRHVHIGWTSAMVAGMLTWAFATYFIEVSGASREVTEGVGSVLAGIVLLSVGLWMHQKSSAGRWQDYLNNKLSAAMTRRSAWALFALSFVAVYREVFETVLFYSALAADENSSALAAGFITAVVLLAIIAWALLRTSARLPIGKFFSYTSVFVAILAVVLIGKGISALQEAGWIGATPLDFPRVELLGIYPTTQTLTAQALVALILVVGFGLNWFRARTTI